MNAPNNPSKGPFEKLPWQERVRQRGRMGSSGEVTGSEPRIAVWDWSYPYAVSMLGTPLMLGWPACGKPKGADQRMEAEIVSLLLPLLVLGTL